MGCVKEQQLFNKIIFFSWIELKDTNWSKLLVTLIGVWMERYQYRSCPCDYGVESFERDKELSN